MDTMEDFLALESSSNNHNSNQIDKKKVEIS